MTGRIWKRVAAVAAAVVAVWLATPIPEVSIIAGLFGGGVISSWIPWWVAWPGAAAGVLVGWHFDVPGKVRQFLRGGFPDEP